MAQYHWPVASGVPEHRGQPVRCQSRYEALRGTMRSTC